MGQMDVVEGTVIPHVEVTLPNSGGQAWRKWWSGGEGGFHWGFWGMLLFSVSAQARQYGARRMSWAWVDWRGT